MDPRLEELLRMIRRSDDGDGENESSESEEASESDHSSASSCSASSDHTQNHCDISFSELKRQLNIFLEDPPRPFRPGDIVMWKEGCPNRKRPKLDEPCVVLEVLDEPLYGAEKSAGSPYFREPLDIVLGMLDNDGDLVRYCYDKRRFRLAVQSGEIHSDSSMVANKIRKMAAEYANNVHFKVGDVVMLKPGFRLRRIPDYSTIAVVAEIVPSPYRDTNAEEGTSCFYELINGRIAFLDSDGDIAFLYVDLRRFRKIN